MMNTFDLNKSKELSTTIKKPFSKVLEFIEKELT